MNQKTKWLWKLIKQIWVLKYKLELLFVFLIFRQEAVHIGQDLLNNGWLECAYPYEPLFLDEYMLYQPTKVNGKNLILLFLKLYNSLCFYAIYFLAD